MAGISFEGQVVVVTGSGGGLGRGYALEIAQRGGKVVVNDLGGAFVGGGSSTLADGVVDEISKANGTAVASYDDVASAQGGRRIIETALDNFGRIDAVIANAGNMRFAAFEDLNLADWQSLLAVPIGGSWNVVHAAWPHMKAQRYGRVVFTSSAAGLFGVEKLTAYGAAKGGVMGLMHGLSCEAAGSGILCNTIMPNALTRMTENVGEGDLGDNPWAAQVAETFDPAFATGIGTFLASSACTDNHGLYSSLGGRVAKTFVGVTKGYQGSRFQPMSADEVAANWHEICDDRRGYGIPVNGAEEYRYALEENT